MWQDGDSSAAKSISLHHPDGKVYKCGGHVGAAHKNNLKEAAKMKFSDDMKTKYKAKFPEIETVKDTGLVVAAYQIRLSKVPV